MNEHLIEIYFRTLVYKCMWLDVMRTKEEFDGPAQLIAINDETGFDLTEEEYHTILAKFYEWQDIPF